MQTGTSITVAASTNLEVKGAVDPVLFCAKYRSKMFRHYYPVIEIALQFLPFIKEILDIVKKVRALIKIIAQNFCFKAEKGQDISLSGQANYMHFVTSIWYTIKVISLCYRELNSF